MVHTVAFGEDTAGQVVATASEEVKKKRVVVDVGSEEGGKIVKTSSVARR
jgi:hypothetical protein